MHIYSLINFVGDGRICGKGILVAERAALGASGRAVLTLANDRRAMCDVGAARTDLVCLSDFIVSARSRSKVQDTPPFFVAILLSLLFR